MQQVAQFMPVDKDQFRLCVQQMLPPLGHIRAHDPSSRYEAHRCDVPLPPLPHFDFSQFASSLPPGDSGRGDESACRVRGGDGLRGGNAVRGRKHDGKGGAGMTQQQTFSDSTAAPAASQGTAAPCNHAPSFGSTPSFCTAGSTDVTPAVGTAAATSSFGSSPLSVFRPQNLSRSRDHVPFVATQVRPCTVSSALAAFRSEIELPSAPGRFAFPVAFTGSSAALATRDASLLGSSAPVPPPPYLNHLPPPPSHFGIASPLQQHGLHQHGNAPLLQPGDVTDAQQPQVSVLKKMSKCVPLPLCPVYYDSLHLFTLPFILVRCIYFV